MRRAFCLLAPLIVVGYLYAQWSDWFSQVELATVWKRPLFSEPIDPEKAGPFEWLVPKETWAFKDGEADLALSLNLYTLSRIPARRNQLDLRVKIQAQGRVPGGEWQNRSIRDQYFPTDEPFSKEGSSIWERQGRGRLEYGLAKVRVVPGEELRIIMDVLVPDEDLRWGRPRMMLLGKEEGVHVGVTMLFRALLRNGGFWLSVCLVVVLALMAWQPKMIRVAAKEEGGGRTPAQ